MNRVKQGIDAPLVPTLYILGGIAILLGELFVHQKLIGDYISILVGIILVAGGLIFFHTSLQGKINIWDKVLPQLDIKKDSKVIDLGCGHGIVLIKIAKKLSKEGLVVGVDLWRSRDQSANSETITARNLEMLKLTDRTELVTADMAKLPMDDNSFDVVVSSFAFHNIKPKSRRLKALQEASRILKSNGQIAIVDTGHKSRECVDFFKQNGFSQVESTNAGFDGWWTGPWMSSYIITAVKD